MPTLVLLHGAWHGAWCWAALESELATMGLATVAVELPAGDADAGIEQYAEVARQAIDGCDEVVVVGHSLGGLVAPVVAEKVGARAIVMLAALWPEPGVSAREQARREPAIYSDSYRQAAKVRFDDGSTAMPRQVALDLLYHDCDPSVADAACARLRPQHWRVWAERSPLAAWPRIPTYGLACIHDRMLGDRGMLLGARRATAPLGWLSSGHTPMLSAPGALARSLAGQGRD